MINRLTSRLWVLLIATVAVVAQANASEQDALKTFEELVEKWRAQSNIHEVAPHPTMNWVNRKIALDRASYDVRKTDSLVSPVMATVDADFIAEVSGPYGTKEEAEAASSPVKKTLFSYQINYSWQGGKWITKSAKVRIQPDKSWVQVPDESVKTAVVLGLKGAWTAR